MQARIPMDLSFLSLLFPAHGLMESMLYLEKWFKGRKWLKNCIRSALVMENPRVKHSSKTVEFADPEYMDLIN